MSYLSRAPVTSFWTIGWAKMGIMRLRLLSVLVGTANCVYCNVVWYSPRQGSENIDERMGGGGKLPIRTPAVNSTSA